MSRYGAILLVALGASCAGAGDARVQAKLDIFGDPLPPGAVARMGTVQLRQAADGDTPLVFSSDGKTLLSVSQGDRRLRFWDVATGKQTRTRTLEPVEEHWWPYIRLSADGSTLAARAGLHGVYVWKTAGNEAPRKIAGEARGVWRLALSADGRLLAVPTNDRKLRILNLDDNTERERLADLPHDVLFSADGKYLVFHGGDAIRVTEVDSGKEISRFPTSGNSLAQQMMACSPDSKLIASWEPASRNRTEQSVSLWEIESGKEIRKFVGQRPPLAFSPDGKLLTTSDGKALHLWDVKSGKKMHTLEAPPSYSLAFAPDGNTLAIRRGAALVFWNLRTGKTFAKNEGHSSEVLHI